MPGSTDVFKKYVSDCFIETGSYIGDGIQSALDAGFKNIISIELYDKYYVECRERFKNNNQVKVIRGDSAICLYQSIKDIDGKITFWLDGHWSGEGTGMSGLGKISPLLEELDQIKSHHIKNHTILIDDMRCWLKENPKINFGEQEIKEKILNVNSHYSISYENGYGHDGTVFEKDILVAKI